MQLVGQQQRAKNGNAPGAVSGRRDLEWLHKGTGGARFSGMDAKTRGLGGPHPLGEGCGKGTLWGTI